MGRLDLFQKLGNVRQYAVRRIISNVADQHKLKRKTAQERNSIRPQQGDRIRSNTISGPLTKLTDARSLIPRAKEQIFRKRFKIACSLQYNEGFSKKFIFLSIMDSNYSAQKCLIAIKIWME